MDRTLGYVRAPNDARVSELTATLRAWAQREGVTFAAIYWDTEVSTRHGRAYSLDGITDLLDASAAGADSAIVVVVRRDHLTQAVWTFDAARELETHGSMILALEELEDFDPDETRRAPPPPPEERPVRRVPLSPEELANVGGRLLAGRLAAVKNGFKGSGPVPFGYERGPEDPKTGYCTIVPEPREAEVVRLMFKTYLHAGMSMGKLVDFLNANSYRTRRDKLWSRAGVSWILRNPLYAGSVRFGDVRVSGQHAPIIARIIANKVMQKIRAQNKRKDGTL